MKEKSQGLEECVQEVIFSVKNRNYKHILLLIRKLNKKQEEGCGQDRWEIGDQVDGRHIHINAYFYLKYLCCVNKLYIYKIKI